MRKNEKENIKLQKSRNTKKMLRVSLAALSLTSALMVNSENVMAASYSGDFRYWSQGGSDYNGMREVGCLITAQAKLLYEANVNRSESFNPDAWYNWLLQNGGIASSTNLNMKDHNAPVYYAKSVNKNLEYLGYWKADDNQLWYNINAGYYTIVHVSGTNTAGSHYVLIDNELSKQTGVLYCYDSFSDRGSVGEQLLSRYSIHNGGHVYKGSNADHTHSYSSSVTAQPACTQPGVKTYSCSCGASYTEAIPKKNINIQKKSSLQQEINRVIHCTPAQPAMTVIKILIQTLPKRLRTAGLTAVCFQRVLLLTIIQLNIRIITKKFRNHLLAATGKKSNN